MLISKPSGEYGELSPFGQTPFYAYRNALKKGTAKKRREYCQSILHFIYAEKFRGNEDCRQEILAIKSGREVEKANRLFTQEGKSRADWNLVKDSIIRCAIRYAMLHHQAFYEAMEQGEDAIVYQSNTNQELGMSTEGHGDNLYGKALEIIRTQVQSHSFIKVGILGTPPADMHKSFAGLDSLFSKTKPDYIACQCEDDELGLFADSWAQTQYATTIVIPDDIRKGMLTHAVVFGKKTDEKAVTQALLLKNMGVHVRLLDENKS